MSNMLERCAYAQERAARERDTRERARKEINEGVKAGLAFLLEAIGAIQIARSDLRLGAEKALDKPSRTEHYYAYQLGIGEFNVGAKRLQHNMYKCQRLLDYVIEFLRAIYDGQNDSDFDVSKAIMQLRNVFYEIDEEPQMIEF